MLLPRLPIRIHKLRLTIQTVKRIVDQVRKANTSTWKMKRFCAIITLDVKNALGSAGWSDINRELYRRKVALYLIKTEES